jgi:hypothetical protein
LFQILLQISDLNSTDWSGVWAVPYKESARIAGGNELSFLVREWIALQYPNDTSAASVVTLLRRENCRREHCLPESIGHIVQRIGGAASRERWLRRG